MPVAVRIYLTTIVNTRLHFREAVIVIIVYVY
jgi:hypothetical protein